MNTLIDTLRHYQKLVLTAVMDEKDDLFNIQLHPDLSPIGWHLGHCIFIENYWLRENLVKTENMNVEQRNLYEPTLSTKSDRGSRIPDKNTMFEWAKKCQSENLLLIEQATGTHTNHILMKNRFLLHFLIQHYSQHYETINMVLSHQYSNDDVSVDVTHPLQDYPLSRKYKSIEAGSYCIGADAAYLPYDNEYPTHKLQVDSFNISSRPVNNAEYLHFINNSGYKQRKYWSERGWAWLTENRASHPAHWRKSRTGHWFGINEHGACNLDQNKPVSGISYYEAQACAKWANARLPHEHEWELACKQNLLDRVGEVWEWCANTFFPYQGFQAFPYSGYSQPYFDGNHYILKGGSRFTQAPIQRPSFRNFYQADKRHQFSGMRLVFD